MWSFEFPIHQHQSTIKCELEWVSLTAPTWTGAVFLVVTNAAPTYQQLRTLYPRLSKVSTGVLTSLTTL
ncbi:hypothetical protein G9A89_011443 [Geosiphon pyriformis]|nr:hypothetical protein G9A89_011443 [Geosiphon pyriformis]